VQEIAWAAVRRAGADHSALEWLPGVVEAKLAAYVDDGGIPKLAHEEVVAWAAKLVSERRPRRRTFTSSRLALPGGGRWRGVDTAEPQA
jgi:hypothetical protein